MKKKSTSKSAFFKLRVVLGVLLCFAAITIVVLAQNRNSSQSGPATAGQPIARAEYRSVMQVFPKQNPYTEAWLAANHGLYDNIWTAEYETRLQQAAEPVLTELLNVLTPNYGPDVRLSNGNVLGSIQNEFQIDVNPTNRLNAIGTSNDGQTAGVGIFRTTDGGLTWTSRDASFYGVQAACCDPGNAFGTDGKAYAIILDTSPAATYILRSTDGGGTWAGPSQVSTPDRPNVAVDPTNSNIVYITFTDFNQPAGRIAGYKSTDGGVTWGSEFLIGDPISAPGYQQSSQPRVASNGWIYVGYQEYNDQNVGCAAGVRNEVARSTDGGATWTITAELNIVQGGACSTVQAGRGIFCINAGGSSFRSRSHPIMGISPTNPSHVYMVYSGGDLESAYTCGGSTGFHSDTLFRRSTDGGTTWTAPAKINTDPQGKDQYYPWMSVLPNGQIWVGWNDRRDDANNFLSKWYQAHSNDEGTTWLDINNAPGNDVVADVQTQPSTFIGDYHGLGANGNGVGNVLGMWFDSRTSSSGDAYTDPQVPPPLGFSVTTTVPACGSIISTQPVDFVVNLTDAVNTATVQATDFTVNGTPANSFMLNGGNTTITFHFNSSPVVTQGVQTMHIAAGAFNRASDNAPNFDFTCTFCYAVTALQVTSTVPAVGGTFSPPAPGNYTYDVNFNQAVDAASVSTSDLTLSMGSVTAVSLINGNMTARFTIHFNFGGPVTISIAAGAITANGCNSNAAFSGNYTVQGCPPSDHYTISQISANIVPGTTDIGNHGDDQVTTIALPFSYTLYDQSYNSANVSSNGNVQFTTTDNNYINQCLPWTTHNYTILPYWDDLYLVNAGFGIFTSVSGSAPNRIFNMEWRSQYYPGSGTANFELRLYEGQTRFDVIYGTLTSGNSSATAGVQKNDTAFDQYFCNGSGSPATGAQSYILTPCTQGPNALSAVSRITHTGGCGTFDIPMPLTCPSGVECRSTGGNYTLVVNFDQNITNAGSASVVCHNPGAGTGTAGVPTASGTTVSIPLTGVSNGQVLNVQLTGVNGTGSVTVPFGLLLGDVNGNRAVNAGDVAAAKAQSGQPVTAANFRNDVNVNCAINAGDVAFVKSQSGITSAPACCP